jgi:hypothetical protein
MDVPLGGYEKMGAGRSAAPLLLSAKHSPLDAGQLLRRALNRAASGRGPAPKAAPASSDITFTLFYKLLIYINYHVLDLARERHANSLSHKKKLPVISLDSL